MKVRDMQPGQQFTLIRDRPDPLRYRIGARGAVEVSPIDRDDWHRTERFDVNALEWDAFPLEGTKS